MPTKTAKTKEAERTVAPSDRGVFRFLHSDGKQVIEGVPGELTRQWFAVNCIAAVNTREGGWAEVYGPDGKLLHRHHPDMLKGRTGGGLFD